MRGAVTGDRRPHAIVVGLDSITGLQTARILADRGIRVIGLVADRGHFCSRTRVCERIVTSELHGAGLIATLRRIGPRLPDGGVLLPCNDLGVLAISGARDELESWYRFVLPDHEVVETLMDKAHFARHAQANGLAVPLTHVLENRTDAERAAAALRYPAVIKPALKTASWFRHTRKKAIKVADRAELLAAYDRCGSWEPTLLAQAWIDGAESEQYTCNAYYDRASAPLVTFVTRKIRQWPPRTGTGCLGEECRNDAVLEEAHRLFAGVGYRGLGYVEMKRERATGRHLIIEANVGRPTGRSATAELAGVEFLYTAYCDAAGLSLPQARTQPYRGTKWIYLRQDLQSSAYRMIRRELTPAGWWRSVRGVRGDAVFSRRDPVPFAADLVHAAGAAVQSALGRRT